MREQFQNMNEQLQPSAELLQLTRQRMAAARPRKWVPRLQRLTVTVACALLIFMGAVNLSPAFASAAAKVPIVRELVLAVSFDPSMKAAIEHNYVQLVKESDSDNGYQIDVEYLVADKANLTVYYKLHGLPEERENQYPYCTDVKLQDMDGQQIDGYGATWDAPVKDGALSCAKFHFTEGTVPEQVQMMMQVKVDEEALNELEQRQNGTYEVSLNDDDYRSEMGEEPPTYTTLAEMSVPLTIDHNSLFQVRSIALNKTITVDGQNLTIQKAEIYPTQMRVYWQEAPDNDKWITSLEFALQGQKHRRWETISNGVSGIGVMGEPRQAWLESSWFSEVEQYQLELTEISLLPKKAVEVTYDYRTGKCTNLPSYVTLKEATPCDTGLYLRFYVQSTDKVTSSVFSSNYLDNDGVKQFLHSQGATSHLTDEDENADDDVYVFENMFVVKNYEKGPITLYVDWAPPQKLAEPITIPLTEE